MIDTVTGENVSFTTNTLNVVWAKSTYSVTLFVNQADITQGTTVNIYLNVTKNSLLFSSYLANVSKDGSHCSNQRDCHLYRYRSCRYSHAYNISSLYDIVTGENVTFTTNTLNVAWAAPTPTPTPTPAPTATPTPNQQQPQRLNQQQHPHLPQQLHPVRIYCNPNTETIAGRIIHSCHSCNSSSRNCYHSNCIAVASKDEKNQNLNSFFFYFFKLNTKIVLSEVSILTLLI